MTRERESFEARRLPIGWSIGVRVWPTCVHLSKTYVRRELTEKFASPKINFHRCTCTSDGARAMADQIYFIDFHTVPSAAHRLSANPRSSKRYAIWEGPPLLRLLRLAWQPILDALGEELPSTRKKSGACESIARSAECRAPEDHILRSFKRGGSSA